MGKPPVCDKNGLKKGPWTAEEDQILIDYIQKHGHGRWRTLPKNAGLKRCGKSCRLRWTNYLRPDIKRGKFTLEEDELIIQLHSVLGNKWSAIAARLPGRTDNEIKNYWNTHIRKKLLRMGIDPITHTPRLDLLELSSLLSSSLYSSSLNPPGFFGNNIGSMFNPSFINLANAFVSTQSKNMEIGSNPTTNIQQQNQMGNFQCQNQYDQSQHDQNQNSQASLNHFYVNPTASGLPNLWQLDDNNVTVSDPKGLFPMQNYWYPDQFNNQSIMSSLTDENQGCFPEKIPNSNNSNPFGSALSTHSSCSTPLNSSSNTFVNNNGGTRSSGTDDNIERDSYCSNKMFIFDVPKGLNVNGCI